MTRRRLLEAVHEIHHIASAVIASGSYVYCVRVTAYVACAEVIGRSCRLQQLRWAQIRVLGPQCSHIRGQHVRRKIHCIYAML